MRSKMIDVGSKVGIKGWNVFYVCRFITTFLSTMFTGS